MNHVAGVPDDNDFRGVLGTALPLRPDIGFIPGLRSILFDDNGVAQMSVGEDDVRPFDPSIPSGWGYSSPGFHMAGMCLQSLLGQHYHADNSTMFSQFEFEQWARTHLFSKLPGCSNARIGGNGNVSMLGSLFYATPICYESLFRFLLNGGKIGNEQIMDPVFVAQLLDLSNYNDENDEKFFGVQADEDQEELLFGGSGGIIIKGSLERGIVMTHRLSLSSTTSPPSLPISLPLSLRV